MTKETKTLILLHTAVFLAGWTGIFGRLITLRVLSAFTVNLTYNLETPCCNPRPVPVLLIMTSNAPDTAYRNLVENSRQTLSRFVGPAKALVSGNTLQLKDYGKTDWPWTMFDPEVKKKRHETVFPEECRKAFDLGAALCRGETPAGE